MYNIDFTPLVRLAYVGIAAIALAVVCFPVLLIVLGVWAWRHVTVSP